MDVERLTYQLTPESWESVRDSPWTHYSMSGSKFLDNQITRDCIAKLMGLTTLRVLILDYIDIPPKMAKHLLLELRENRYLVTVSLVDLLIGDELLPLHRIKNFCLFIHTCTLRGLRLTNYIWPVLHRSHTDPCLDPYTPPCVDIYHVEPDIVSLLNPKIKELIWSENQVRELFNNWITQNITMHGLLLRNHLDNHQE